MYCCTSVEKEVSVDHYDTGCELTRNCIISDEVSIRAETMTSLLSAVGAYYGIEIDDVWTGGLENGFLSYNRLENADGDEPSETEKEEWKRGERTLYLADWTFQIEKITVSDITADDLVGVKTHE
jgi:hypothetical protein